MITRAIKYFSVLKETIDNMEFIMDRYRLLIERENQVIAVERLQGEEAQNLALATKAVEEALGRLQARSDELDKYEEVLKARAEHIFPKSNVQKNTSLLN